MSDINFLNNQNHDDQEPKTKDDLKEKLAWSKPEKETKSFKSAAFSLFPFLKKKMPADKPAAPVIDKNKIKQSREEILNLIKHQEKSKPIQKDKAKNFFSKLREKFKKQLDHKEALIDYQRIFDQEKESKQPIDKVLNVKPAVESQLALKPAKEIKASWFNKLIKSIKSKIIDWGTAKSETVKIIKLQKDQEVRPVAQVKPPPAVKKEDQSAKIVVPTSGGQELASSGNEARAEKIADRGKGPIDQDKTKQRILEPNLITEEIITFFDWRGKIIILTGAVLTPVIIVGLIYYGLIFYQKDSQAKNLTQIKKFEELNRTILRAEAGLKEIIDFQNKLKKVSRVFSQHIYWTNFFKFLEDETIKDVYFNNFEGDTGGLYAMNAIAAKYSNIAQQIDVLENNKNITSIEVSGGAMEKSEEAKKSSISFKLIFSVAKNIFTK